MGVMVNVATGLNMVAAETRLVFGLLGDGLRAIGIG
jgi:hypothetical protein